MGAQGTATLDFGAFPGTSDASVVVTGLAAILAGSLVEAWIFPAATADHSADEHFVETISVMAGSVVAGTGFTIFGMNTNQITEPLELVSPAQFRSAVTSIYGTSLPSKGGKGTLIYGLWNVAWVWN